MRTITSATVFMDAVGLRMSATYSEIDDESGRIISDNRRFDRVITDESAQIAGRALLAYATDSMPQD
jgi:hypothetical protein